MENPIGSLFKNPSQNTSSSSFGGFHIDEFSLQADYDLANVLAIREIVL